jgi:uncharacterized cysteine cluster protein YcgN (CxxCxxCC family)
MAVVLEFMDGGTLADVLNKVSCSQLDAHQVPCKRYGAWRQSVAHCMASSTRCFLETVV